MNSLGINIGSSSIKAVLLENNRVCWRKIKAHEGDYLETLNNILATSTTLDNVKAIATGTEGRYLLNINSEVESLCIEKAVAELGHKVNAVVSLGGENFVIYVLGPEGTIVTSYSGNKCASGTGEFFKQQLRRMDMDFDDISSIPNNRPVQSLSSRCSVFLKSDCTHKLNKGEAHKGEIVLSLCDVMATRVADFLNKAGIRQGKVLLIGGVTRNPYFTAFLKKKLSGNQFIIPDEASYFEAYGAALLAAESGSPFPSIGKLYKSQTIKFDTYDKLNTAQNKVHYLSSEKGEVKPGGKYILGVDGGSTTTKVTLIDFDTEKIVAEHYGRTHGDPVKALKICLIEIRKQIRKLIGDEDIIISLASTTGSSREILGVFLETPAVFNEIIAHSVGATHFKPDVNTLFEIGGQDAKYMFLENGVPIDYAMNEACSAGTGSFIEEAASGDLNIHDVMDIGNIAVSAESPLKFGEQCSAFINSDIRKAIQQGASREDITAGIILSVVSNYLNRVMGNRTIGQNIVLQGGVSLNKAIPLAFAMLLNREITIPPHPELLGCFGAALLAKEKSQNGIIEEKEYAIDSIIDSEIIYEKKFRCKTCENQCPIQLLRVNDNKYPFGGRCNKYANQRKKNKESKSGITNYIEKRDHLLFIECAPNTGDFVKKREFVVGIPKVFSVYTLWPFYSWFFHLLGIRTELSKEICHEGIARTEGAYCYPAEIAHGAVQDSVNSGFDYIFVPHLRDLISYEKHGRANFCPLTQSLPYYIRKAFLEIPKEKFLAPVISFLHGERKALDPFIEMGKQLGIAEKEIADAFKMAWEKQGEFWSKNRSVGVEALKKAREADHPVIAVLGRPYNAFTPDANLGIPLKFVSRDCSVIPFDMLPFEEADIFDNMYWYEGQQNMKACVTLKEEDNIFVTFISNFSCAPDSFILHYVKWIMGAKPFLILELDSHTADAGIDTRIEAFLDIIEGYNSKKQNRKEERFDNGLRFINNGKEPIHLINNKTNERIEIFGNKKIKMLLSSMGNLATELLAATVRYSGINAEVMPLPDPFTLQLARNHMSGKECLPSQLVLGSALRYFASAKFNIEEIYVLFVPTTKGPCRTGQYHIFYENLFKDLELENVIVVTLDSDNSYSEIGASFSRVAWWSVIVSDYMKDVENALRACAENPSAALATYEKLWRELIEVAEKDITQIIPSLKQITKEVLRIPLKRKMIACPKVLIVGEVYVRRDDFSVDELIALLSGKGIIGKVSGVSEWVYFCDFYRKHEILKRYHLIPWYRRWLSRERKELLIWQLETAYKRRIDKKVQCILQKTGLLPASPHDMDEIIKNAVNHFVSHDLYSEITVSSGVAATAMEKDYSGIINISPFACLIGRTIEGLITPWLKKRNNPVISIEIDGNILPPNIINKLEIFMLNVQRFRR
jgi:predicted CoA-substrate-specific enzyme activase